MKPTSIWVHSNSNWNLGVFLMFLGGAIALAVPALLSTILTPSPLQISLRSDSPLVGAVLAVLGFGLLHWTRKGFRVEPGKITVKEGLFSSPMVFRWQGPAAIQLHSHEDEHGEWWAVDLVCGKPHYAIHRSLEHATECRSLAVALARAVGGALVENDETTEVVIPPEELELPFTERLKRHPQLLGPDVPRPVGCSVQLVEKDGALHFRWKPTPLQLLPYVLVLLCFSLAMAGAPLFPGTFPAEYQDWRGANLQVTAFERLSKEGNYDYFLLCATFLAVLTVTVAGYRKELSASPTGLSSRTYLWGIPLSSAKIPLPEFREIWVRRVRNGAILHFVSPRRLLGGRVSDQSVAHWVASRVGRYYAQLCL